MMSVLVVTNDNTSDIARGWGKDGYCGCDSVWLRLLHFSLKLKHRSITDRGTFCCVKCSAKEGRGWRYNIRTRESVVKQRKGG